MAGLRTRFMACPLVGSRQRFRRREDRAVNSRLVPSLHLSAARLGRISAMPRRAHPPGSKRLARRPLPCPPPAAGVHRPPAGPKTSGVPPATLFAARLRRTPSPHAFGVHRPCPAGHPCIYPPHASGVHQLRPRPRQGRPPAAAGSSHPATRPPARLRRASPRFSPHASSVPPWRRSVRTRPQPCPPTGTVPPQASARSRSTADRAPPQPSPPRTQRPPPPQ